MRSELPTDDSQPRSTAALVVDRTFGPWFWGNMTSNSGNWLFNVAAAIVVYQLSRSAFLVGMVSVAQFTPLALLSPWIGALSDRLDRRRVLLTGQCVAAVSALALAVPAMALGVSGLPGAWVVLLASFGLGVGKAIATPALNSLVPSLVDDVDLENAVSLTTLTFQVGRALGPATAGVLLATLGAEAAFLVNAISFLVFALALLFIRGRPMEARDENRDRSVRAGLRHVRHDRAVLLLLAGVSTTGFAADPVITLAPSLSETLGGGDALVAAMVSSFGIMAIPAALLSGRFQRKLGSLNVAAGGMSVMAAGLLVAAIAPAAAFVLAGFALTGIGMVLGVTSFTSNLHRRIPDEFRGRIMALWSIALLGTRPVAAMIDGAAADLVGPRPAMSVAILAGMLGALCASRLKSLETVDRHPVADR